MNREQAVQILRLVTNAILETIQETGDHGAPGGILYAALMHHGMSLEYFQEIMAALVQSGKVIKRGELYFAK